jgi:hypothetical protein
MAKAGSPGQGVDDLVRRSAGIPAAFLALFEAEPEGAPKRLLKKAMPWLLSWARGEPPGGQNGLETHPPGGEERVGGERAELEDRVSERRGAGALGGRGGAEEIGGGSLGETEGVKKGQKMVRKDALSENEAVEEGQRVVGKDAPREKEGVEEGRKVVGKDAPSENEGVEEGQRVVGKDAPSENQGVEEGQKVVGKDAPSENEGVEEGQKVAGGRERVVKAALEGMVPQVHAFNTLRVAFGNTNLGTDTSGFAAEGLMVAVQGFASPHWEVSGVKNM